MIAKSKESLSFYINNTKGLNNRAMNKENVVQIIFYL